jgi:hypothetical protein
VGGRWPGPAEARQSEGGPELCLRAWGFGVTADSAGRCACL